MLNSVLGALGTLGAFLIFWLAKKRRDDRLKREAVEDARRAPCFKVDLMKASADKGDVRNFLRIRVTNLAEREVSVEQVAFRLIGTFSVQDRNHQAPSEVQEPLVGKYSSQDTKLAYVNAEMLMDTALFDALPDESDSATVKLQVVIEDVTGGKHFSDSLPASRQLVVGALPAAPRTDYDLNLKGFSNKPPYSDNF